MNAYVKPTSSADTERDDGPECEPPCPVVEGRMGLLCTCGNTSKRWKSTADRLIADRGGYSTAKYARLREAAQDFYSEWRAASGLSHERGIEAVVGIVKEALGE